MSRLPRAGEAAGKITIRVTEDERVNWKLAASKAGHPTISAAVVAVMNAWERRVNREGKGR